MIGKKFLILIFTALSLISIFVEARNLQSNGGYYNNNNDDFDDYGMGGSTTTNTSTNTATNTNSNGGNTSSNTTSNDNYIGTNGMCCEWQILCEYNNKRFCIRETEICENVINSILNKEDGNGQNQSSEPHCNEHQKECHDERANVKMCIPKLGPQGEENCPAFCDHNIEETCYNHIDNYEFCVPRDYSSTQATTSACPIFCENDKIKCTNEWNDEFCFPKFNQTTNEENKCPLVCENGKHKCQDPNTNDEFCLDQGKNCPRYCDPNFEIRCFDKNADDFFCYHINTTNNNEATCPEICDQLNELDCHNPHTSKNECILKFNQDGSENNCPVYCNEDYDKICFEPSGNGFCTPKDMECPVICKDTEIICYDPISQKDYCFEKSNDQNNHHSLCPLICHPWQIKCFDPNMNDDYCFDNNSMEIEMECPEICNHQNEQDCYNPHSGKNECHPLFDETGLQLSCPLYCAPHEKICKDNSNYMNHEFCLPIEERCPNDALSCNSDEQLCSTDPTSTNNMEFCIKKEINNCPMFCPPSCNGDIPCPGRIDSNGCHLPFICPYISFGKPRCPVECSLGFISCQGYDYDYCAPENLGCKHEENN